MKKSILLRGMHGAVKGAGVLVQPHVSVGPGRRPSPRRTRAAVSSTWQLLEGVEAFELRTVGIDVGSSTTHLSHSRVRLERLATELSSRYVMTGREELWRSPVLLTPYADDGGLIDAARLADFLAASERASGLGFEEVDTGAVLLTGAALERSNAQAVANAIARDAGRFVCAAAGHHLEAELAAHGSGAVGRSRATGAAVLAVDVGGSTTKLARCEAGAVVSTGALGLGSRLMAWGEGRRIVRLEGNGRAIAAAVGADLEVGSRLSPQLEEVLAARMAEVLVATILGRDDPLARALWLTEAIRWSPVAAVSFSGGVAEFLSGREQGDFGDLGRSLAEAIRWRLAAEASSPALLPAGEGIRATVIGVAQFSTQVSGSTVLVGDEAVLPAHGVPVVRPAIDLEHPERRAIAEAARRAMATRREAIEAARAVALAFSWEGDPSHERLLALGAGVADAVRTSGGDGVELAVLVVDRDLGASLGRIMAEEIGLVSPVVVALDGLELGGMDFVDLAPPRRPSGVVPVVVKSLLFAPPSRLVAEPTPERSGMPRWGDESPGV